MPTKGQAHLTETHEINWYQSESDQAHNTPKDVYVCNCGARFEGKDSISAAFDHGYDIGYDIGFDVGYEAGQNA